MYNQKVKVQTNVLRKLRKIPKPIMCKTCLNCKDRSICNNRNNLKLCNKCKNCKKHSDCDMFYFTEQSKANLIVGIDKKTNKPITKVITGKDEENVYRKIIDYKEYIKNNGVPIELNKYDKSIYGIGIELEKDKFGKGKIGGNTYSTNIATLNRLKQYDFSNISISKVTKKDLNSFLESERIKSNSLLKKDYSMLRRIYEYATDRNYININFFNGFDKIERPISKKADKSVEALTLIEQKNFENYIIDNNSKYSHIFLLLIHTGIRIGECLALDINDIDFESNQIRINKILSKEITGKIIIQNSSISKTKNGTRQVGINKFFKDYLLKDVELAKNSSLNTLNLLFYGDDYNLITTSAINSAFKRICEKINIVKNVNTHCLRHTFATRCIEAGVSLPVLQSLMGHDKIQTTIDTYGHIYNYLQQSEKQKYINYLSK